MGNEYKRNEERLGFLAWVILVLLLVQMKKLEEKSRKVKIYRNKICFTDKDKADQKRSKQSSDDTPEKNTLKSKVSKLSESIIDNLFDAHQSHQLRT